MKYKFTYKITVVRDLDENMVVAKANEMAKADLAKIHKIMKDEISTVKLERM